MDHSTLFLSDSLVQCTISPKVIMSILDHYQRRPTTNQKEIYPSYVVGLLFGKKDHQKSTVIINNAFATIVQINPENGSVATLPSMISKTIELQLRSSPKECLVGWYKTGLTIDSSSKLFHQQFSLHQKPNKKSLISMMNVNEFVHILVDTALIGNKLTIKAYTGISIFDPVLELEYEIYANQLLFKNQKLQQLKSSKKAAAKKQKKKRLETIENEIKMDLNADDIQQPSSAREIVFHRFNEISISYYSTPAETIGMDTIIKCPPDGEKLDSPSLLMGDANDLELTLQTLLENLEQVEYYVQQVINGEVTADTELGWIIADAISAVPALSPQKFEQMLSGRLQDLLMLVYLGKLTRAQLAIADRINRVLYSIVPQ